MGALTNRGEADIAARRFGWPGVLGRFRRWPAGTLVAAAVALTIVAAGAATALALWQERRSMLEDGAARAVNMTRLLDEQTLRTFMTVELALQGIVDALQRSPELPYNEPAFQNDLREKLRLVPNVRALFVIGPDGYITHDTDHPNTPRVSLADRDYFRAHEADPSPDLRIGAPLLSRSTNRWFVSVSRRMTRPDGGFGGVAVAAVEPAYYETFFRELRLGPEDSISLFHHDGTLIARTPDGLGRIGAKLTALSLFESELPTRSSGVFVGASELFDGRERTVSYRTVGDFPLIVTVALNREVMLASWRRNVLVTSGLFVTLSCVVSAFAVIWLRRLRERRETQHRAMVLMKLRALGQMSGSMAHDFNNVLAVVEAGLRLIDRNAEDPAKVRAIAQEAQEAAARANGLVSQLQAFARGQELDLRTCDAADLLRRLEPVLRRACGASAELELELGSEPLPCSVDSTQFDATMLNLVVNARDAMPKGGVIRIAADRISWKKKAAGNPSADVCIRILVEDEGEGMPDEVQRRIFDPFFTTKAEKGGTGLGLAQVYGFMQQIGGDVLVRSRVGKGTTFELLLPCPEPNAKPQERAAE